MTQTKQKDTKKSAADVVKDAVNAAFESEEQKEVPKTAEEQVAELTEMLQRKQAEFVNYQNRMAELAKEQTKFSTQRFVEKLLPIVDMFDMAVAHKDQKDQFIAGMEMVHKQFHEVLENEGVKSESQLNQTYDPTKAQAMSTEVRDDVEPDTVVTEMQKAYTMNGRVLRHARVVVSKQTNDKEGDSSKA